MIATGISSLYTDTTVQATSNQALGKDDFLKLLVTQLQNQDPLNPMDNTAFTAQLAQFSSLEELQNLNSGLAALSLSQKAIHNTQALALIGQQVSAPGDTIALSGAAAESLDYELAADAADVAVYLYDSAGNLAASRSMGALSEGRHTFQWDGTDDSGATLADGTYKAVVLAADASGNNVDTSTYVLGTVDRVLFDGGSPQLVIGDRQIDFNDIDEATAGAATAAAAE